MLDACRCSVRPYVAPSPRGHGLYFFPTPFTAGAALCVFSYVIVCGQGDDRARHDAAAFREIVQPGWRVSLFGCDYVSGTVTLGLTNL